MLDLTDETVRAATDAPLRDLSCAWEDIASLKKTPPSWSIAERLQHADCAGIITPSFASGAGPKDINVVFWKWSRRKPYLVRVIDDEDRLPKNDASWR